MIVDGFGRSARNFQSAGYDGVEIHAAHGYLVAQFLSPASNRRSDAYRGDTLEGRTRLLFEVVDAIREQCGVEFPIGVRLSADEEDSPMASALDDTLEIVDLLQETSPRRIHLRSRAGCAEPTSRIRASRRVSRSVSSRRSSSLPTYP